MLMRQAHFKCRDFVGAWIGIDCINSNPGTNKISTLKMSLPHRETKCRPHLNPSYLAPAKELRR